MGLLVKNKYNEYMKIKHVYIDEENESAIVTVWTYDKRGGEPVGVGEYEFSKKEYDYTNHLDSLKAFYYPIIKRVGFKGPPVENVLE